jgi:hypothetical protein
MIFSENTDILMAPRRGEIAIEKKATPLSPEGCLKYKGWKQGIINKK